MFPFKDPADAFIQRPFFAILVQLAIVQALVGREALTGFGPALVRVVHGVGLEVGHYVRSNMQPFDVGTSAV